MKITFTSDRLLVMTIRQKKCRNSSDVFRKLILPNEKVSIETGDYVIKFTPIKCPF